MATGLETVALLNPVAGVQLYVAPPAVEVSCVLKPEQMLVEGFVFITSVGFTLTVVEAPLIQPLASLTTTV